MSNAKTMTIQSSFVERSYAAVFTLIWVLFAATEPLLKIKAACRERVSVQMHDMLHGEL